ncbi:MAG TPA: fumarate reductase subunit C [Acidobacteriota bacterium]
MRPDSGYRLYHPKWYRRRMPIFWWLGKFSYTKFITREMTSMAVAYGGLLLLAQIWMLGRGEQAYQSFLSWLRLPAVLAFHLALLAAVLLHTITWLNLAPQALVVRLGGRRIPDGVILAGHYLAWLVASAAVAWLLLGR